MEFIIVLEVNDVSPNKLAATIFKDINYTFHVYRLFGDAYSVLAILGLITFCKVIKFLGSMRITPPLGLSISEIKKKDTEITKGKIMKRPIFFSKFRAPKPTNKLAQMAIAAIKDQAV
jgi:hypothetical protein